LVWGFLFLRVLHAGTFLDFVDTSIVVLSGTISIANTAEFNGGTNRPCSLMGAEVCAVNHFGVGEGFWCATTNEFGLSVCPFVIHTCQANILFTLPSDYRWS
jgi:hypothetical protein